MPNLPWRGPHLVYPTGHCDIDDSSHLISPGLGVSPFHCLRVSMELIAHYIKEAQFVCVPEHMHTCHPDPNSTGVHF